MRLRKNTLLFHALKKFPNPTFVVGIDILIQYLWICSIEDPQTSFFLVVSPKFTRSNKMRTTELIVFLFCPCLQWLIHHRHHASVTTPIMSNSTESNNGLRIIMSKRHSWVNYCRPPAWRYSTRVLLELLELIYFNFQMSKNVIEDNKNKNRQKQI